LSKFVKIHDDDYDDDGDTSGNTYLSKYEAQLKGSKQEPDNFHVYCFEKNTV